MCFFAGINGFGTMYVLECDEHRMRIMASNSVKEHLMGLSYADNGPHIMLPFDNLRYVPTGHNVYKLYINEQCGPKSRTLTGYMASSLVEAVDLLVYAVYGPNARELDQVH